MSIESTILLSNISTESVDSTFKFSDKKKGAGYYRNNDGTHTVVYDLDNFSGTIKIQATLEMLPGDNDWVDVIGTEIGGDSTIITSAIKSITFKGKFAWIRAAYNIQNGTITEIRYNY